MIELKVADFQAYNPWPHSPTAIAKRLVPPGSLVLDVGCASGYMARELREKGCRTVGIEIDAQAAELAKGECEAVIPADLEMLGDLPYAPGAFDVMLCLDVLEHLARPDLLLRRLRPYLASGGWLLASIPNVARLEVRLNLLLGRFDYADGGILSKGHLRFFTRLTARQLLASSGFAVKQIIPTGLGSILSAGGIPFLAELAAFQFVFVAAPNGEVDL